MTTWVREPHGNWFRLDDEKHQADCWEDLVEPVLVRDGVTS